MTPGTNPITQPQPTATNRPPTANRTRTHWSTQVNVFLSMSASLRQMSAMMWPGFDTQGLAWFVDMTKPAVEWGTWGTPYGVAGMLLPLAVFGAYVRTLEYTSVGE